MGIIGNVALGSELLRRCSGVKSLMVLLWREHLQYANASDVSMKNSRFLNQRSFLLRSS